MTHDQLTKVAVKWLKTRHKCKVVFSEMRIRGCKEIPDALGWRTNTHSIVIECKTSRSDFLADKKKYRFKYPEKALGYERWYMTPQGLLNPEEVPVGWGLVEYTGSRCIIKKKPSYYFQSIETARAEMKLLIAAARRYDLGIEFSSQTGKFKPQVRYRKPRVRKSKYKPWKK